MKVTRGEDNYIKKASDVGKGCVIPGWNLKEEQQVRKGEKASSFEQFHLILVFNAVDQAFYGVLIKRQLRLCLEFAQMSLSSIRHTKETKNVLLIIWLCLTNTYGPSPIIVHLCIVLMILQRMSSQLNSSSPIHQEVITLLHSDFLIVFSWQRYWGGLLLPSPSEQPLAHKELFRSSTDFSFVGVQF